MAQLKLDASRIEESYGVIKQVANSGMLEATNELGRVLLPEEGSNELCDELLTQCRAFQDEYNNNYLPSVNKFLGTFEELIDVSEYLEKKATVGSTVSVDTSFAAGSIKADDVKM